MKAKKFIVSVSITFMEGRYNVEFMRCALLKNGMTAKGKGKFSDYSFSPSNRHAGHRLFKLLLASEIFSRPSVHFGNFPMTNAYTSLRYDKKRIEALRELRNKKAGQK